MQSFVSSDYLKFNLLAIFPSLNLGIRKILALSSAITHLITKHIKLNIFFHLSGTQYVSQDPLALTLIVLLTVEQMLFLTKSNTKIVLFWLDLPNHIPINSNRPCMCVPLLSIHISLLLDQISHAWKQVSCCAVLVAPIIIFIMLVY
jgi:hypothetical protein